MTFGFSDGTLKRINLVGIFIVMLFATICRSSADDFLVLIKDTLMQNYPTWYMMLGPYYRTLEEDQIRAVELLRIMSGSTHEQCWGSIMSTPWAVEKTQYESLAGAQIAYPALNDRDRWKRVLMSRFVLIETSVNSGLEIHEFSPFSTQDLKIKISSFKNNIDSIINTFLTFSDLVKFVLCFEEEMGNFSYAPEQSKVLEDLYLILGTGRPSLLDMKWYKSILSKLDLK